MSLLSLQIVSAVPRWPKKKNHCCFKGPITWALELSGKLPHAALVFVINSSSNKVITYYYYIIMNANIPPTDIYSGL